MKKLILVAAVVLSVVATQAASVEWASGKLYTAASAEGGFSATAIGNKATAYLFTLTADQYNSFSDAYTANGNMSKVYETYKGSLSSATATGATLSRGSTSTLTTSADVGAVVYGAIIYTYTDSTLGKDFYIANIATGTVGSDMGITIQNLGLNYLGDATGTAIGGWQVESTSPVPEPTSAMLLALGLCGLALKRKQA